MHGHQNESSGVSYLSINREARGHEVRGMQCEQDSRSCAVSWGTHIQLVLATGGGAEQNGQRSQRLAKPRGSETGHKRYLDTKTLSSLLSSAIPPWLDPPFPTKLFRPTITQAASAYPQPLPKFALLNTELASMSG